MESDSRRSFLKKGALAALGVGAGVETSSSSARTLPRVGIVGGGLAGVACGWLLDGVAEAVLFESRAAVGGHAHTIPVGVAGRTLLVDVGAQFFAPGPQPTYWKLLELIGLRKPEDPSHDATLEAEMTITVTTAGQTRPRFVSPSTDRSWPILAPWNRDALLAFFVFALAAKRFTEDGDWLVPLDDWLRALPVRPEEREDLLLPLLSAMVGCSIEQARTLSARGALVFVGRALPENLLDPFAYSNSLLGLGGNVRVLAGASGNLRTHAGSPVTEVAPLPGGGYAIRNAAGIEERVDVAIFATPPFVTRRLLPRTPALRKAFWTLRQFDYFAAEIAIHRDPAYMPPNPVFWSAYNPVIDGAFSEASIWYGALRPAAEGEPPLMLFKSWATARSRAPAREVFRRRFLHPLVTPEFVQAQRLLAACRGREGIWFAGSYTHEVDSQETALVSAMNVVRELAPQAPNLLALEP